MCLSVRCFTALMMARKPSTDSLTLFYGLLPNCSIRAINLSPAIPKHFSNQWEIMSVIDGPAFLFLPLSASPDVLSVSFLQPPLVPSLRLIPPVLFYSTRPSYPLPLGPAPEMRQLSSSEPLAEVAFSPGICR